MELFEFVLSGSLSHKPEIKFLKKVFPVVSWETEGTAV
jgi:hypothetical protein